MRIITILFIITCLSACGFSRNIGNENLTPDKVAAIQKGKTSKAEVLSLLGPPQMTQKQKMSPPVMPAGTPVPVHLVADETWSYWSHNTEGTAVVLPFYAQTTTKSNNYVVTIYFDTDGTVLDTQELTQKY